MKIFALATKVLNSATKVLTLATNVLRLATNVLNKVIIVDNPLKMIELMRTWVFAFPQAVGVAVMKIKSFGLTIARAKFFVQTTFLRNVSVGRKITPPPTLVIASVSEAIQNVTFVKNTAIKIFGSKIKIFGFPTLFSNHKIKKIVRLTSVEHRLTFVENGLTYVEHRLTDVEGRLTDVEK